MSSTATPFGTTRVRAPSDSNKSASDCEGTVTAAAERAARRSARIDFSRSRRHNGRMARRVSARAMVAATSLTASWASSTTGRPEDSAGPSRASVCACTVSQAPSRATALIAGLATCATCHGWWVARRTARVRLHLPGTWRRSNSSSCSGGPPVSSAATLMSVSAARARARWSTRSGSPDRAGRTGSGASTRVLTNPF